jgi:hypothetical protein
VPLVHVAPQKGKDCSLLAEQSQTNKLKMVWCWNRLL